MSVILLLIDRITLRDNELVVAQFIAPYTFTKPDQILMRLYFLELVIYQFDYSTLHIWRPSASKLKSIIRDPASSSF